MAVDQSCDILKSYLCNIRNISVFQFKTIFREPLSSGSVVALLPHVPQSPDRPFPHHQPPTPQHNHPFKDLEVLLLIFRFHQKIRSMFRSWSWSYPWSDHDHDQIHDHQPHVKYFLRWSTAPHKRYAAPIWSTVGDLTWSQTGWWGTTLTRWVSRRSLSQIQVIWDSHLCI